MGDYDISLGYNDYWYLTFQGKQVLQLSKNRPTQEQTINAVGYHQGLRLFL